MPVTVIVGGQFGSEGKGKVAYCLAKERRTPVAIRVGGTNSGHTAYHNGKKFIFRQLPTPSLLEDTISVLTAGSYIDLELLLSEIKLAGLNEDRLIIDPNAVIITQEHKDLEASHQLTQKIGSTQSGTGGAVISRILRSGSLIRAEHVDVLKKYTRFKARSFLRAELCKGTEMILEGTQGYGLSLLHSDHYPKTTSRDTSAAGFISEAGLSPMGDVEDIIVVLRTFPIRVAGDSGPLPNEITWADVARIAGYTEDLTEFSSATNKKRRVGRFDLQVVRSCLEAHPHARIVLNHLDYIDKDCRSKKVITAEAENFLRLIEQAIQHPVDYVGFCPESIVDRTMVRHESAIPA